MPVIALTSDKGSGTPESNIMAMRLSLSLPEHTVLPLTYEIKAHDFIQAADTIKYFRSEFPQGSIHVAWVDSEMGLHGRWLMASDSNGYVIAPDNGLIPSMFHSFDQVYEYFPEKGETVYESLTHLIQNCHHKPKLALSATELKHFAGEFLQGDFEYIDQTLRGRIIYVDQFGNLVTSISKSIFQEYRQGRDFQIILTRHDKHSSIEQFYSEIDIKVSELICRFNRLGRLEIALNRENASQLLGLKIGKPVMIEFY